MERKNRYFIETFGCQMNVNDSEKVAGLLEADGYEPAPDATSADFVFINTCAVREKAAEKLFHALGRLKRLKSRNPGLVVGVGGCVAQLQGTDILERAPYVDVLVGTHNFGRVPELVRRAREGFTQCVDLDRKADTFAIPSALVVHGNPVRAFVTVMEGCNHVCSFCVVPRTRGPEVNRSTAEVVAEVDALVKRGVPEVMLLGQTVNAYRHGSTDFSGLLAAVDAVPGLQRLRFTTSHPSHVDARFARTLRDLPTLCPHLHLPVQSGSDRVLASMRRGYTRAEYLEIVGLLREQVPDLALSSDIIVGYPGETEEDFAATVSLVEKVGFESLFVFMYSPRPGTTAVRSTDDVPEADKLRRLQTLNNHQQRFQALRNTGRIGGREVVLVESRGPNGRAWGRSADFKIVHIEGGDEVGSLVEVTITAAGPNALQGHAMPASNSLTESSAVPIF